MSKKEVKTQITKILLHHSNPFRSDSQVSSTIRDIEAEKQIMELIEKFFISKELVLKAIPRLRDTPKGDLTGLGREVRYRALGYNQAIKDFTLNLQPNKKDR